MNRLLVLIGGAFVFVLALTISERPAYSHKPITTPIMFQREIAQIFQRKCFQCHSDRNVAMSLTTYELARPWAVAIREEILARHMPPWGAVAGFGHFSNDLGLTQREMDIILSWTDGGAPSGVLKAEESTPPVFVPSAAVWDTAPDETLAMPAAVDVKPGSGDQVKRFDVKSTADAARALRGIAFKPGDRRVVRYAAIYDKGTGRWLWTWTPWQSTLNLPAGVVYRVPARAAFTVEIGYRAADEEVSDTSELGLYFAKDNTPAEATATVIAAPPAIAANSAGGLQRVRAELTLDAARRALAVWPEPGPGAQSVELSAVTPDGVAEPLLWVKDVRADWPTPYVLRTPRSLAKGTRLVMTAYYDSASESLSRAGRITLITAP